MPPRRGRCCVCASTSQSLPEKPAREKTAGIQKCHGPVEQAHEYLAEQIQGDGRDHGAMGYGAVGAVDAEEHQNGPCNCRDPVGQRVGAHGGMLIGEYFLIDRTAGLVTRHQFWRRSDGAAQQDGPQIFPRLPIVELAAAVEWRIATLMTKQAGIEKVQRIRGTEPFDKWRGRPPGAVRPSIG